MEFHDVEFHQCTDTIRGSALSRIWFIIGSFELDIECFDELDKGSNTEDSHELEFGNRQLSIYSVAREDPG